MHGKYSLYVTNGTELISEEHRHKILNITREAGGRMIDAFGFPSCILFMLIQREALWLTDPDRMWT